MSTSHTTTRTNTGYENLPNTITVRVRVRVRVSY